MGDSGDVTIVIPHWNRADLLARILKQLGSQTYPIHEVIVVDNGSTDDSAAAAHSARATWIEMGSNAGFAPAVNRGIQAARSPWVVILNNDVTLPPEWLQTIITAAAESGAAFAAGKLLRAEGGREHAPILDGCFDAICRGGTAWRCGAGRADGPLWSERRVIQFAPLTAALFQRDVFDRVGPLDERFESFLEDVDFGLRCSALGIRGVYVPGAAALHIGSATLGAWHKATVHHIARNQMFLIAKHFQGAPRWPVMAAHVLWCAVALRHGAFWSCIRGKWDGWRRRHEMRGTAGGWRSIQSRIEESENEIRELQRQSGFDAYWRWYFMLTKGTHRS